MSPANQILGRAGRSIVALVALAVLALAATRPATAAQKAFFLFQSPGTETVPSSLATNFTVSLIYSNTSGTINNAVFTNGVTVTPAGQGLTASLNAISPAVADNGGTATLPLTISATATATANTTYQIVVNVTNSAFTANVPAGVAALTNLFTIGLPANSNAFSIAITPAAASCQVGTVTNLTPTVTFVDYSTNLAGVVTNGVSVSGPDTTDVTAVLNSQFATLTGNLGQTNLTLTINVSSAAAAGTYTVTVTGTNSAFTANPTPGVASAAFTLNVFSPRIFALGLDPATETVPGGVATNTAVTVTFTNVSGNLTEPLTNSVTVVGPDTANVTAALNSRFATPPAGGGTATLTLSVANNGFGLPGSYQVIVAATNGDFSANTPVQGFAAATNYFTILPITHPSIRSFALAGATLEVAGINGLPGKPYVVLSTTNLGLPLPQWTPLLTNVFDSSGNFDTSFAAANTANPNAASQFFVVALNLQATNFLPVVATAVFSPGAAPYYADTPVTISSATPGATIRYTTDGSTPSEINGTIYTGPVTMQQAIYTNFSVSSISNASGVTMLKAVAYKSGMLDSAVFTGNYIIIVPLRYPQTSSLVLGLAHMAYNVSSSNWNSVLSLWTNYLGFDTVVVSNAFALVKINDQQFIEFYQRPINASQYQLANYGFYVSDAEAFRQQLTANGVSVPPGVTTNALGNLSFLTTDPDGHTNEWVQYLPNSLTSESLGQHMPGTQLFGYMEDYGDATANTTAADNFYNQCGFSGTGTKVYLPNNNCYLEMLTYTTLTQQEAGKHEKAQLVTFRGMDVLTAANILQLRDPSIVQTRSTEGGSGGIPTHNAVDVYNADLSRIRMIDINY